MKKLKICLLLFLSATIVFAGCAGINGYLKVAPTNLSVASFYHNNYLLGISAFQNVANDSSVIYTETDRLAYKNYTNALYELLPEERCLISAVDYLYEINNSQNASVQKVKVKPYEYRTVLKAELAMSDATLALKDNYANVKAVVLLERADKTTSLEINTYLFYMDANADYEVADLQNNVQNAHYVFTFVQTGYNVQTKTFSLKYNTGCTASATFTQEKGCLAYTLNSFFGQTKTQIKLDKNIYKYSNGTAGIRVVSEFGAGGANTLAIYEQMTSDFYKRVKVGEVKDRANMLSMETMPEDRFAVYNASDNKGYLLVYDERDDSTVARIVSESYGLSE